MSFQEAKGRLIIIYSWMISSYSLSEKGLDLLVQAVCAFSEDVGIEFGTEKCATLVIEKGKIVKSVGIELTDGKVIKSLQEGKGYKYLGILEVDGFLGEDIPETRKYWHDVQWGI